MHKTEMYDEITDIAQALAKPHLRGAINAIAEKAGVHRNTVRSAFKKCIIGPSTPKIIDAAREIISEYDRIEESRIRAILAAQSVSVA